MVDETHLASAITLLGELQQLTQTIALLRGGGRITMMDVVTGQGRTPEAWARAPTQNVVLPPALIEAIAMHLQDRETAITAQLGAMGVGGEVSKPAQHAKAAQHAKPAAKHKS